MFQKFRSNARLQLLGIAGSIAVISHTLGLAAYLTDVEPMSATFKMRYGRDFGVEISSDSYKENAEIIPGETAPFDPVITNNGNYDAYVYMEVNLPDKAFSLEQVGSDWRPLTSAADNVVYYYGTSSEVTVLPAAERGDDGSISSSSTSPLCSGIHLNEVADLKQGDYTVQVTGYAIQADGLESTNPSEVWDMVGGNG